MAMDFPVSPVDRLPIFPDEAASAAALMEICGDPACSEGEAGNVYVLDEEAAGHGPEVVEKLAVIHNRADSENAASAQSMGKIDP